MATPRMGSVSIKASSKRTQSRLNRILYYATPEVDAALAQGKISIRIAEFLSHFSPSTQNLALAHATSPKRPYSPRKPKNVIPLPPSV